MRTSESIKAITPAFLKAQIKIESVIKEKTNPFFNSKYADLTSVIEACKDKLNAEGIAILQPIDGMNVETILIHESGEWFSSLTPIVSKDANNPQALGSAISYAKRYGLQSMVLLPAEDDDGNVAVKPAVKKAEADPTEEWPDIEVLKNCPLHKKELKDRGHGIWDHRAKGALKGEELVFNESGLWYICQGKGWHVNSRQEKH